MKLVTICSPFTGDVDDNVEFARDVCWYALQTGHAPFAPHLFYTQFSNDESLSEREMGHKAGLDWGERAAEIWFCLAAGGHRQLSAGMQNELDHYTRFRKRCRFFLFSFIEEEGDVNLTPIEFDTPSELQNAAQKEWLRRRP